METDKRKAALSSVIAAIFLTTMKIIVGFFTGSLGILSEALHSGLDLCAAVITFFAVKFSTKPADSKHHYGHAKIESFSALIETLLLLITCVWIIYEAIEKLFFGKPNEIIGSQWGIAIMLISIVVDCSRVRVLKKAAKEHGSLALEADALHFSSDVLSSAVVIVGLICVWIGNHFNIPFLKYADPIAALGVAILVIKVSIKLGKETINVLLDTAPDGLREAILNEISAIDGIVGNCDIRIRPSGSTNFIDIRVGVDRNWTHKEIHATVHILKEKISTIVPKSDIIISTFPATTSDVQDVEIQQSIINIVRRFPNCVSVHNTRIYEIAGKRDVAAHIELKENITLKQSHKLSHDISSAIQNELSNIDNVNIYFQRHNKQESVEDITESRGDIVEKIIKISNEKSDMLNCHDVKLYRQNDKISAFFHCELGEDFTVDKLELVSRDITQELKKNIDCLDSIHIHFEPNDMFEQE